MDDRATIEDLRRRLAAAEAALQEVTGAQDSLRDAMQRYGSLFQAMDEGYLLADVLFDGAGRATDIEYVEANEAAARMVGTDLTGKRLREISPDYEEYWYEIWGRVATSGRGERHERYAAPEDTWYDFYVFKPNPQDEGSRRVAVLFQDISRRKQAEIGLRESEQRFRALATAGSYSVYRMSPDWRRMYRLDGRGFLADTGDPSEDWLEAYILPEDRDVVLRAISDAIRGKRLFELEHRVRRADGGVGWTLSRAVPILAEDGAVIEWLGTASDVTARKESEAALRASEERQAFLLKLSDALRPMEEPFAIQREASRILRQQLGAIRVAFAGMRPDDRTCTLLAEDVADAAFSLVGMVADWDDFDPVALEASRRGETFSREDLQAADDLTPERKATFAGLNVRGFIGTPLVKAGRLVAFFVAQFDAPRRFGPYEIAVTEETAERTWAAVERARAEAALRASEERFQQFAASSADALWIRDAATLTMEYASPAIRDIYGVPPEALLGDSRRWGALVVPEDRDAAFERLEQARRGEAVVHEFRIQRPSDQAFRWIRNTDFPLHGADGRVQRIGGIAHDVTEEKLSAEHRDVLLAELQHRVRNIMAIIRSIAARTGERAESVPDYAALLAGRLLALARVQALLTRAANAGVGVATIVHDELSAQAQHEGQYGLEGPEVALSPKTAEVLTLAIHELTTNALKYGALALPNGRVRVRWTTFERRGTPWLSLEWTEEGAPEQPPRDAAVPRRRGFGSELIEGRIPYELGGRGKVAIGPGGARCHLEFPLKGGDSILETDAPRRAAVFGGALNMAGEVDLSGQRILVIEDDYYLATDTARALQGAGSEVIGPCPSEEAAHDEMAEATPTGAVVDINLGEGPSFELARELRARGVPIVFVTGYDAAAIPPEFENVERLQKPVDLRQIVSAVAKTLGRAA